MPRYEIEEIGFGHRRQDVHSFEDIDRHHPDRGNERGRVYGDVASEREELLGNYRGIATISEGGNHFISKDFILKNGDSQVVVPAAANGYIGKLDPRDGIVQIYDKPASDPSREMIAQYRHLDLRGSKLEVGQAIEYGEPLAPQGGFNKGNPRAFGAHVHLDINASYLPQVQRYISDIDSGAITTEMRPERSENLAVDIAVNNVSSKGSARLAAGGAPAMADGVLKLGETNDDAIKQLQDRLNALGVTDARGQPLVADRDFGSHTEEAVKAFQKAHGIEDDGKVGKDTLLELDKAEAAKKEQPSAVDPLRSALLSDPGHKDHAMYRQAVDGLEKLGGFGSRQDIERAAATLTHDARVGELGRIDHVVSNGVGLFAVQGGLNDPGHQRVYVDRQQAIGQTVEQSSQLIKQDLPDAPAQQPLHQTHSPHSR